jgi:hypothetical protein
VIELLSSLRPRPWRDPLERVGKVEIELVKGTPQARLLPRRLACKVRSSVGNPARRGIAMVSPPPSNAQNDSG